MPRLLGTEDWDNAAISRTVNYLLGCAEEAPALSRMFGSTQVRDRNPAQEESTAAFEAFNARMELVTDALALLLVSDELQNAKRILDDPWWILGGHAMGKGSQGFGTVTIDMRQFVRLSLFSALGGSGRMRATSEVMLATMYQLGLSCHTAALGLAMKMDPAVCGWLQAAIVLQQRLPTG